MRDWFILLVSGLCLMFSFSVSVSAQTTPDKLLHFLGITRSSLSPSRDLPPPVNAPPGDIWVANLERETREALTTGGVYRWPVFESGGAVLALTGDRLVRITLNKGAKVEVLRSVPHVVKLVGFDRDNPDRLLVTRDQPESPLAVLSVKSGNLMDIPYDALHDSSWLEDIQHEERVYPGEVRVYVKDQFKGDRRWTDVYILRRLSGAQNVSLCDGNICGQPSLSRDQKAVVYIQSRPEER